MITFWGEVGMSCLVVYAMGCYLISMLPSPKLASKGANLDCGLQGSNKESSQSKYHGWY